MNQRPGSGDAPRVHRYPVAVIDQQKPALLDLLATLRDARLAVVPVDFDEVEIFIGKLIDNGNVPRHRCVIGTRRLFFRVFQSNQVVVDIFQSRLLRTW